MKVILAKKAGFCMGVRRAVETTLATVHREEGRIATFGPLIHNPQVLEILQEKGVESLKEVPRRHEGTIIIRAHGVPPETKQALKASGAQVMDATCPRVVKVQVIIRKYRDQGYATVIIGDSNHAEVVGLMGYAGDNCHVVSNERDVDSLRLAGPYIIVSQTTQDNWSFDHLSQLILARFPEGRVFNTICDSTHKRQDEVRKLARRVDALVVVGGRASANTQRLGEIAQKMGRPVFMVETEADLELAALRKFDRVGVTAGASTPTWMINRVVRAIESIPGANEGRFKILLYKLIRLLLATNLYVSLGGGLLTYAACLLQGIRPVAAYPLISFGYLFAMHNLNRFAEHSAQKFNDPVREAFNRKYRLPLLGLAFGILAAALGHALTLNTQAFWLLVAMSVLGILYQVQVIPKSISSLTRIRGLKEIPGSKTLLVAVAWAFVAVVVPGLVASGLHDFWRSGLGTFAFVLLLVFFRNGLFDVFDVQGDRIVGRETFPVVFGERRTIKLLYAVIGVAVLLLLVLPPLGLMAPLGYWLVPAGAYLFLLLNMYEKNLLPQGSKLEFLLESLFVLIAFLAWLANSI